MIAAIGGIIVLACALLLYLASPNRKILGSGNLRRGRLSAGLAGLVLGLVLILQWAGTATSVFIVLTLAMLVLTIVPLAVAWWQAPSGSRR